MNRYKFILSPPKPKLIIKKGNLLSFTEDALIHGIAVKGAFKSALGKEVANKYPRLVTADSLLKRQYDNKVYGKFSSVQIAKNKIGYNLYIQRDFDKKKKSFDYKNLAKSLRAVADDIKTNKKITSVAVPRIGVGFSTGRANWDKIKDILYDFMEYSKLNVSIYSIVETE